MKGLLNFIKELNSIIKIEKAIDSINIREQRLLLSKINEFLYTNYNGIGTTIVLNEEFEYFSEFHKYWEKNHKIILNPRINDDKCKELAEVFHNIYCKFGDSPFKTIYEKGNLRNEDICKIRFLTANQDFRGSLNFEEMVMKYDDDPNMFEKEFIFENPEDFISFLELGIKSQTDKRKKYAKTIAGYLIGKDLEPIDLFEYFNSDYLKIKNDLLSLTGSGYGRKKIDMFLRDMRMHNIWDKGKNFHTIDVASDVNTMKVALRTGILETDIQLLSSFLDIFCYQYGLIDSYTAKAWRRVWEFWSEKYPHETIDSPSGMDYLIYRIIGKEICNETLHLYRCNNYDHEFYWPNGRKQICELCAKAKVKERSETSIVFKDLPCKYVEGKIVIEKSKIWKKILPSINSCPFVYVCNPEDKSFRKLNPPKSISIRGRTGWETAYTRKNEGGGGLMA